MIGSIYQIKKWSFLFFLLVNRSFRCRQDKKAFSQKPSPILMIFLFCDPGEYYMYIFTRVSDPQVIILPLGQHCQNVVSFIEVR